MTASFAPHGVDRTGGALSVRVVIVAASLRSSSDAPVHWSIAGPAFRQGKACAAFLILTL